jgi:hypothetical protein
MTSSTRRAFLVRRLLLAAFLILLVTLAKAGGPKFIVGTSFFTPGTPGQPVIWANGAIRYYTDQGDLSPILDGADADAFVADAFARWSSPPSVALVAIHGGQLAEDVSGANVIRNPDRSITMPADIQPSATSKPVSVVYDYDGTVTDALLGTGAGDPDQCFSNAVFGGPDAFAATGNFAHALIVLNGNCIQQTSDLLESKYRLMRVLGTVLGLDWSQLNLNVITGVPRHPTADDQAGFPLMHAMDPPSCVPITLCYPDPANLKMDDRAAISRLYPVTAANLAQFPGKQPLAANTARVFGKVTFTDSSGNPTEGMQAVNVVARWIDPSSGQPSGQYAASSVSGFLFRGNSGNTISGYADPTGQAYDQFGSTDSTLEGFFDLGALELPSGATSGQYQISVEPIDPLWSIALGPYQPNQVTPSGSFTPAVVNVTLGTSVEQDAGMVGSAEARENDPGNLGWGSPLPAPTAGRWCGALSAYGDTDYFWMNAQANRTMAVEVTALDETEQPTAQKLRPMIGMWALGDPQGTAPAALSFSPFNTSQPGMTRLSVQVLSPGPLRIGVADLRGDGRPDFTYVGHVLYGDSATPTRLSVQGGTPLAIQGIGFKAGMTVSVGNTGTPVLAVYPNQILATAPSFTDGVQSITVTDPTGGAYSSLINVLTFGAAATDSMLISQSNPAIPVGGVTPSPIRVTVNASDGVTPVDGATVQWSVNNNATLSLCRASTCTELTDESGHAETRVTLGASGATTVTAQLAPAAYPNIQVQTTLSSTTAAKSISLMPTKIWGTHAMSLNVPLTARVLTSVGTPVGGQTLNFTITAGTGTLSPPTVTTGNDGYGYSTLQVPSLSGEVGAVVCAATGGIPCPSLNVFQVSSTALHLQPVSGAQQAVTVGQSFTTLRIRVFDSSSPPNPVFGVPVAFTTTLMLPLGGPGTGGPGSEPIGHNPQRVIVGSLRTVVTSDVDGYAAIIPSNGGGVQALDVDVSVDPGNGAALQFALQTLPAVTRASDASATPKPTDPVDWFLNSLLLASPDLPAADAPNQPDTGTGSHEGKHPFTLGAGSDQHGNYFRDGPSAREP